MSLALFVVTFSSCSSFETVEEFKTSKSVSLTESTYKKCLGEE